MTNDKREKMNKVRGAQEQECLNKVTDLMLQNGDLLLLKYFQSAVPNSEASEFPDFLLAGGYIEHFRVYTSKENKKGADQKKVEHNFNTDVKIKLDQQTAEWLQSPPHTEICVNKYEMQSPEYSYEYFVKSFKRNFENHITSLKGYNGEKENGIFLIEAEGGRITVLENGEFKKFYLLQYDKDILEYLYGFVNELQYVVFLQNESYEILKLADIPQILMKVPKDITFGVGRYINISLGLFMDI